MAKDDDEESGLSDSIKIALMRQRQQSADKKFNCLHRAFTEHMKEAPTFRQEMRDDNRLNRDAITSLRTAYDLDKDRRDVDSKTLDNIDKYIRKEKTIEETNKKNITIAAAVIGSAITIFAAVLLFVGDVLTKFWNGDSP